MFTLIPPDFQRLRWRQRCRPRTPSLCRYRISPRLWDTTSRVAAAAVAANTKAPRSDGRIPRRTPTSCPRGCLSSRICSNRAASSSWRASSTPHARTAPTPSLGPTREPRNSPTLKPLSLVISTRKQFTARVHGTSAIFKAKAQALELANAAQFSSGGTYDATPWTKDENGGNGGAKRARYQGQRAMPESHYPGLPGRGMCMMVAACQLRVSKRGGL